MIFSFYFCIFRIKNACSDVTDFALANYRNSEISLACVLFIELAGQDSLPLRACLIAANILHENMTLSNEQEYDKSLHGICKFQILILISFLIKFWVIEGVSNLSLYQLH